MNFMIDEKDEIQLYYLICDIYKISFQERSQP